MTSNIYYFFQVDPFIQNGSLSMTTNSSRTTTAINSIDLNLNDDNEYESITTYAGYITYFVYLLFNCAFCTVFLKFIYSEKATKFYEIFSQLLTVCTVVKSKVKISQNFVAFSEYMNFKQLI